MIEPKASVKQIQLISTKNQATKRRAKNFTCENQEVIGIEAKN